MSISTQCGQAQQWAQTHFGEVALGDARRGRRVVALAAGWAREPGASMPRLSQGQAYAGKAAYRLLGHAQATPDALQAPHRQHVAQQLQAPGTFPLAEDTTELGWPAAAERRPGLGPVGPGKATNQGVLLHPLVAAAWPATGPDPAAKRPARPLRGLLDQQLHVRQPVPEAEKASPRGGSRPRQARARRPGGPAAHGPWAGRRPARAGGGRPRSRPLRALAAVPDAGPGLCGARGVVRAAWCARPRTGPWWPGPTRRPRAAFWHRPAPSPARARLPWPCAGGRASRPARRRCR